MIFTDGIEQLTKDIHDTEMRLHAVRLNIIAIQKELATLEILKDSLEDNIATLKRKKVITLAIEFKKAKYDLEQAQFRLRFLNAQLKDMRSTYLEIEKLLLFFKNEYDKLMNPIDNVIFLNGEKNEQK